MEERKPGKSFTTAKDLPVELIYYKTYKSEEDARHREKRLKYHRKRIDSVETAS